MINDVKGTYVVELHACFACSLLVMYVLYVLYTLAGLYINSMDAV